MAAPPPKPALKIAPRSSTALSAVFQRLGGEVPPPPPPPRPALPRPAPPSPPPQLLGFAEPVAKVPPIEDFLAPATPAEPPPAPAILDVGPPPEPIAPPPPAPPPEPARIRARVRDLPPAEPSPVMPRPQNLVGRLGRRPEPAAPRQEALAAPEPSPEPSQKFAAPGPTPGPASAAERGGRPSLPRNRRLYRRAKLPAEIEIDGVPCTLIDVSIGGFAATGVPQLEPNALVPVMIRLTIDGIEVGTLLRARIIYVTQGRSSGRFVDLSPSQMAFLRYIVTWRGESVGAVGTTTLLDAIATGAERGYPGGAGIPADPEAKSRWWAGLIGKKVNPPR